MSSNDSDSSSQLNHKQVINDQYYILKPGTAQLDVKKKQKLQNQNLFLQRFIFYLDNWQKTFNSIEILNHQSLQLNENESPSIILDIAAPIFANLYYLNLSYNFIKNIEALVFLDCPKLSELNLSLNQISSVKPLSKTKWNSLNVLSLQKNPIREIQFNRFKVSSYFLFLNFQSFILKNLSGQKDISILAKFESIKFLKIMVCKQFKVGNFLLKLQTLKKKYPEMTIRQLSLF